MGSYPPSTLYWIVLGYCNILGYRKQIQYQLVHTDEDTVALAEKFIDFGVLKKKSFDDCQHIAAAILAGCDIITSWNFKHIVNVKTVRGVKTITTLEGYKDLLIYPPSVLLEGDDGTMTKPIVSKDFNLEDIQKIREYNSLRHVQITPREIIEDTRKGAAVVLERRRQSEKVSV